ncbi:hypothetical protein ACFO1B_09085 [Dactylosporangium siamense]|uniref:hypothetical protein n=1 Tax=Dactylosporangium siamense TaxID=685454 RepID=UPI0019449FAF|nr:hypothetical protein [Dactylosporangium siamense]
MGIDLHSIAVPLGADPVRAIRADPQLWESACDQPPFAAAWGDEPLPDISRALLAVVPAGTGWVGHFGDRSFQQAEYLLDPAAYRAGHGAPSAEYRIIGGDEVFAGHATSGQGFPWRCSSAAFLEVAVRRVDALDVDAARREFSAAEMVELGVYKAHGDESFDDVLAQLRAFAGHCRAVAAAGLDLIITRY